MATPRSIKSPSIKPRRGRPPEDGYTKTDAERARTYRARRKRAGIVIGTFDPRQVRRGRPLTADERQQLSDALQNIKNYKIEIKRLRALNAKLRKNLGFKHPKAS